MSVAPAVSGSTPAVAMRGIAKRFGAVQANRDVELRVAAATVHGIVGENGAGKSTLMAILYGFYRADAGSIEIDGRPVRIAGSRQAIALGIGMVHQHFMLVDTLSALDNVMLGAEPGWRLRPARAQVRARLNELMRETGLEVDLDAPVAALPVGERQRLEILKALYRGARILILDEPTAVLTPQETAALFATLRRLRERGTTILLITHKLKEIVAICDAVTVMRGGAVVLDCATRDTSIDGLAEAMVGRRVDLGRRAAAAAPGAPLLEVQGLSVSDALGVPRLTEISLTLRAGEIVGIAGVAGNGQTELLDALSGLLAPAQGELRVGDRRYAGRHWITPRAARALRIAHVPEDRHRRGLVLPLPAWESALLGYQSSPRYSLHGWLRRRRLRADCAAMMERYDVRPRDPLLRSSLFSGGNQQKLVLAREAMPEPRVLLVGQPTRGVDIGAIEFIHGRLRALRDAGSALLVVSSELDEILALADRVLVMNGGRIAGELPIGACSEAALGRLMGGAGHPP
ncbi:MAG: ABC transporter ATP-binding protein [Burkholderiales bacterium]|nr:ABC transporter ATP-binding protein [Burkholderiales bacterium]MDE1927708.1 ABC transporter ATP-binding protein [Burkholderiales bacterium]MDE2158679.1 ABC transporter ATP-binding protein [Burkholderiales bacterium]MDE2501514.1 ABC transporter ATP-binding protein [Burkholderiales bacterium]